MDGFTKLVELQEATIIHNEKLDMDGIVVTVLFVRIGSQQIDGHEVWMYKMLEPKKDSVKKD